jgi:hypothetical protein
LSTRLLALLQISWNVLARKTPLGSIKKVRSSHVWRQRQQVASVLPLSFVFSLHVSVAIVASPRK